MQPYSEQDWRTHTHTRAPAVRQRTQSAVLDDPPLMLTFSPLPRPDRAWPRTPEMHPRPAGAMYILQLRCRHKQQTGLKVRLWKQTIVVRGLISRGLLPEYPHSSSLDDCDFRCYTQVSTAREGSGHICRHPRVVRCDWRWNSYCCGSHLLSQ